MSNADSEELVTASSDGVTVEKSFEPDDFPVPAIAFVLHADREEPVSVRLVDTVPSHVPPEDIGFHPKYGAEYWDVEGETIVFEREFEPGEEYTTVYGLRGGDADDADQFMSEPTIESVEPPLAEGGSGDVVRDVIGDDTAESTGDDIASAIDSIEAESDVDTDAHGSPPGAGGPAAAEGDLEAGAGTKDEIDTSVDVSDVDAAVGAGGPAGAATGEESLVAALAAEVRAADHDDEDLRALRDAMDVDLAGASVEARIEHLQSQVADMAAYTDALEEFLDENGTAEQLVEDLRADLEETRERLEAVEATADEAAAAADDAAETAAAAAESAEAVDEQVEARVDEELSALWDAVDEAAGDAADVSGDVESLRADLESLEADLAEDTDERLSELESDVESLSEELSDVAEMRDRLASALGGLAGDAGGGDDADDQGN